MRCASRPQDRSVDDSMQIGMPRRCFRRLQVPEFGRGVESRNDVRLCQVRMSKYTVECLIKGWKRDEQIPVEATPFSG